jgi:ATP-dependent helicase YprA (DUF1998 family)
MTTPSAFTIQSSIDSLADELKRYLEAQYHVRDDSLVRERRALFDVGDTIAQQAYLEATPSYETGRRFRDLSIPAVGKNLLTSLAALELGVFDPPYIHQSDALEAFIGEKKDIIASTGTGSGKTEIFLYSILAAFAEQASANPKAVQMPGCRALVLYPMNALVADQLSRIRNMAGNETAKKLFSNSFGRHLTFGMYTGRTPFPGDISEERNERRANELLNEFVRPILDTPDLLAQLKGRGKWPSKDMEEFFGKKGSRWANRLKTNPNDAELYMRHEMQDHCPDILITNYSMLEYMLLRPIEQPIFDSTATYLAMKGTYLTFVLDEAHMYRGTTGAEVAYLIRRLMSRLRIGRDKVRFILTTASVGKQGADIAAAIQFAERLTNAAKADKRFLFIKGTIEKLADPRDATRGESEAFAAFDTPLFRGNCHELEETRSQVNGLLSTIALKNLDGDEEVAGGLYLRFSQYGPACKLLHVLSGNARRVSEVAALVFPNNDPTVSQAALDALLAVTNAARLKEKNKVLLPARLHLFLRGVAGIYGCVNPRCPNRRIQDADTSLLGKLYPEPRIICDCGSRVFEILTHRDCGSAFLRAYGPTAHHPEFLWHEPSNQVGQTGQTDSFEEIELFIPSGEEVPMNSRPVWLQLASGKLTWDDPSDPLHWRLLYVPDTANNPGAPEPLVFQTCPACASRVRQQNQRGSKILDLRTKGEQPFGHIIKQQLISQPCDNRKPKEKFPNQGRKVLVFSDGRQKAARLAQSLPQELGADCFRELLVVGNAELKALSKDLQSFPLPKWYAVFVAACHKHHLYLFDKLDARKLLENIQHFQRRYNGDLADALEENAFPDIPLSFKRMLYKQACSSLYSLPFLSAGWLFATKRALKNIIADLSSVPNWTSLSEPDQKAIVAAWIRELAHDIAIDVAFPSAHRALLAMYERPGWGHSGRFPRVLQGVLTKINIDHGVVSAMLIQQLAESTADGSFMLRPNDLALIIDLSAKWWNCSACTTTVPNPIAGHCPACGSQKGGFIDPNTDVYTISRKGFWRDRLRKVEVGEVAPVMIHTEEHTAQLTHKDAAQGQTRSEFYELRFQDITRDPYTEPPIDVLSCTTTMEVGIDIGSLTAVALRNVPPQRENYQQRAGRAGRRGASISTVATYCQGNAHDNYYFSHVFEIAAGDPRQLYVTIDNEKIARRHVHSFLLQQFFAHKDVQARDVMQSLGRLADFYSPDCVWNYNAFNEWITSQFLTRQDGAFMDCLGWLGTGLTHIGDLEDWIESSGKAFVHKLQALQSIALEIIKKEEDAQTDDPTSLLDFLFQHSQLPTYAFPTNLATFAVESWNNESRRVVRDYAPQQAISRALSEYAPGRIVVIDKNTYRSQAVTANVSPVEHNRASKLFNDPTRKPYVFCSSVICNYVEDAGDAASQREGVQCPLCQSGQLQVQELITPECFLPAEGKTVDELDDEAEFSYATPAQFPVPLATPDSKLSSKQEIGSHVDSGWWDDAELVVVNKGDPTLNSGFHVCTDCGIATLANTPAPRRGHRRPYRIQKIPRQPDPPFQCNGEVRTVFLGSRFRTDLLILQVEILSPLYPTVTPTAPAYLALNDALQTLAECLPLAIARRYDLDHTEFSSGYRIRAAANNQIRAELYLYDTLSGGAGYAQKAGQEILNILQNEVLEILKCEDNKHLGCDRSCYKCLRHYHNQFVHSKLDRFLAHDLLLWMLNDTRPKALDLSSQLSILDGLMEMLRFDGLDISTNVQVEAEIVPFLVSNGTVRIAVETYNALLGGPFIQSMANRFNSTRLLSLNEYQLSRNLPSCYQEIRRRLTSA